jgi:hypothetical protein
MDPTTRILTMGASGSAAKTYIEDVFSTWLYTGNGSTQTITNGIDLAGEGGLVWTKSRSRVANHRLNDTARGSGYYLASNTTGSQTLDANTISQFNSDGYDVGSGSTNTSGDLFASWTFRKAEKFFDVVTYTGDGVAGRTISHSLGSTPGFIVVKATSTTGAWYCLHTGGGTPRRGQLNSDAAFSTGNLQFYWGDGTNYVAPTASDFTVYSSNDVNGSGITYVAYLFAHDAGGFGDDGNQSVIKCGSYTGNGSTTGPVVDLGWEPQFVIIKNTTTARPWQMMDSMRGLAVTGGSALVPNDATAETANNLLYPSATGFYLVNTNASYNANGENYIYIAIRRGPMKTPTDATTVFKSVAASASGTYTANSGFPVDLNFYGQRAGSDKWFWFDRMRGTPLLQSNTTGSETSSVGRFDSVTSFYLNGVTGNYADFQNYAFRRAPGYFDVVAYTGTGTGDPWVNHSLGVSPEALIIKSRNTSSGWNVLFKSGSLALIGNATAATPGGLNYNASLVNYGGITSFVSATQFQTGLSFWGNATVNTASTNYIAYLFASCPGVSKVGSYTGTGTTKQIDCGFTAGARFVLIKRTDSTGDWYVWDSARGIIAGNDPYLLLNSAAAEVTNTDYIDTYSAGFEISSTAPAAINASGGSFIFLAIA